LAADFDTRLFDVAAVRMAVDEHAFARAPAEQAVEGKPCELPENVPQRHVDGRDGSHRHRPTPPVRAAVKELPGILDPAGVPTDEVRDDVLLEIGSDGKLPPIERRVAQAVNARASHDLQGHEVSPGTGDDHSRADDLALASGASRLDRRFTHAAPSFLAAPR
jgi:hypothetical protein